VSAVSSDVVKEFAPTGTLRTAINQGNSVLAQKGPNGEALGITVDLARELGKRLGVPVELVIFDAAGKAFEGLKGGLDIGFLAIEPVRAADVDFTAPYVLIEGTYMVPKDSALKAIDDVDRAGVRIGVNKNSAYDLFLTRTLKNATLLRSDNGVAMFKNDKLEAAGGVRQPLEAYARTDPSVRVMDGRFMAIQQAMGMPKGRPRAHAYLKSFVEEMKASGFCADALKRSNQPDAQVAPKA
jgi:polar amino acid transport system substrate-binding protein